MTFGVVAQFCFVEITMSGCAPLGQRMSLKTNLSKLSQAWFRKGGRGETEHLRIFVGVILQYGSLRMGQNQNMSFSCRAKTEKYLEQQMH